MNSLPTKCEGGVTKETESSIITVLIFCVAYVSLRKCRTLYNVADTPEMWNIPLCNRMATAQ